MGQFNSQIPISLDSYEYIMNIRKWLGIEMFSAQ